jgi:hypothetical protein
MFYTYYLGKFIDRDSKCFYFFERETLTLSKNLQNNYDAISELCL